MIVTRSSNELEVFATTIYAEARGEPVMGQIWVAWVIKNRARQNRQYWGGNTIKNVCLHNGQIMMKLMDVIITTTQEKKVTLHGQTIVK
ncbi:unnamed protein product [Brachionus calyciflorus]|uniref:Cell wall hydrolase SleB domain-containing protein n=1 Tax=Brachionus calyciflorus TaxID=104777 RepID=A0A814N5D4_9BILA|nr:unnamed protein product [Brachionus calyciflorus]